MDFMASLRTPRRALLALAIAGVVAGCGDNAWSGLTGVGVGNDSEAPRAEILAPDSTRRIALGDSVFVQVRLQDNAGIDSVALSGFVLRGSPDLGTQVRVEKFVPKVVALSGGTALVRDTTITRYLVATSDSVTNEPVYIVAAVRDLAGNTRADTVTISVGGPRVAILEPVSTTQLRAGSTLRVRVQAADSTGHIVSIRLGGGVTAPTDTIISVDPARALVDTVVVLSLPGSAQGTLKLQASARSANGDSAVSNPVLFEVLGATPDVVPPSVRFSVAAPRTAEIADSVAVTVVATDSSKVRSVGVTVVPSHRKLTGTVYLPLIALSSATDSATFRFSLDDLGITQQGDTSTVRIELTAFATDTAGNCAAATVPGGPLSEQCSKDPPILTGHPGSRSDILLVRGVTVHSEAPGDRLADLVSDGKHVFVSNFSRNRVEVLPVASSGFSGSIAVGSEPWGLAIGNSGDTLLVANSAGTNISVVPLSTQKELRRLRIPDIRLYGITYDVKTDSVTEVTWHDYSDRPQFIAQMAGGEILYSTKPTETRSDGTVRIYDRTRDQTNEFNRVSEVFTGYAEPVIGRGIVVNALAAALSGSSRLFVCPRRLRTGQSDPACITATATVARDSLAALRAAGLTDTRLDLGAEIESVGLTDTTFVAVSGDHSAVAFGEGAVNPGRIFHFRQIGGKLVGSTTETTDLVGNVAEPVIGLGLNGDGSLGMARFDKVYFFDDDLRLQGQAAAGSPSGGGAMDPRNQDYPVDDGRRRAYASGVDDRGLPFVDVLDSHGFRTIRRVFIRNPVVGGLIAVPVTASDPASGELAMRLFAITTAGVVEIALTPADLR
jgi:hypothetical protein